MNNEWILTTEQMPKESQWVLTTTNDYQKPIEIQCYMGIRIGTEYVHPIGEKDWIEKKYEYPAWTSGHGDISSHNPIAWMPLPTIPKNIKEKIKL